MMDTQRIKNAIANVARIQVERELSRKMAQPITPKDDQMLSDATDSIAIAVEVALAAEVERLRRKAYLSASHRR